MLLAGARSRRPAPRERHRRCRPRTEPSAAAAAKLSAVRDALVAVDAALGLVSELPPETTEPMINAVKRRLGGAIAALDEAQRAVSMSARSRRLKDPRAICSAASYDLLVDLPFVSHAHSSLRARRLTLSAPASRRASSRSCSRRREAPVRRMVSAAPASPRARAAAVGGCPCPRWPTRRSPAAGGRAPSPPAGGGTACRRRRGGKDQGATRSTVASLPRIRRPSSASGARVTS